MVHYRYTTELLQNNSVHKQREVPKYVKSLAVKLRRGEWPRKLGIKNRLTNRPSKKRKNKT